MKVALYESRYSTTVHEARDWIEEDLGYVRVSEVVEIEFVRLPNEVVVPRQVKQLDSEIEKVRAQMGRQINLLEEQKSKLLAITQEPA